MSSQPIFGPGGQARPAPERSTPAGLDLDYANHRLRAESFGMDQNGGNNANSEPFVLHGKPPPHRRGLSAGSAFSKFSNLRHRTQAILVIISAMLLATLVFCIAVFAVQAQSRCMPKPSGITRLSYGSYQGQTLSDGVDQYLGMRYASVPSRFSAPQYPSPFSGVQQATKVGPGCQGTGDPSPANVEDCLFVDVYKPTNANPASNLPVYVFIQGGGLMDAGAHFNGTGLIVASNMSIVVVSFTYRVGLFGFLASSEIQANASLNNGYLDQRQVLQWVQKEIQQFGGNANHVVLGGQSAGAGSIVNHLTSFGGVNQNLFHGAIMESQSMPPVRNVSQQQFQYDDLVNKTGCSTSSDTLGCLRGLPYAKILAHGGPIPYPDAAGAPVYAYNPVRDGKFIVDLPVNMMAKGNFIKVPTVFGDDTNEGTVFTPSSIKTTQSSRIFINNNYPTVTDSQLDKFVEMYNLNNTDQPNYWLQASWAYGETRYTCPGIYMSSLMVNHSNPNVWNWRYNIATPQQEQTLDLVSHGSELGAIWGPQFAGGPGISDMLETNATETVTVMQGYWLSFIKTLDPNKLKPSVAPTWDAWNGSNRVLFDFNGTAMETIGGAQLDRCGYLNQIAGLLQQ